MQSLGEIDHADDFSREHLGIEGTYSTHTHYRAPVGMLLEGCGYLGLPFHGEYTSSVAVHRVLQAESVVESHYIERAEHSG